MASYKVSEAGNSYIDIYNKPPELGASATGAGKGGGNRHPYVAPAEIHMPTQHHTFGINFTALSEGNWIQKALYETANSFNIPIQFLMFRGIGDSSMRNLDGTSTSTDQGVMAFGTLPLWFIGGGEASTVAAKGVTTSDGFLFGSIGFKTPFDLKVGLYASENTLKYGSFKWSTMTPNVLSNTNWFGRNMLQITHEFQPTLGVWNSQIIPKGTYIKMGLVGPQNGGGVGTWIQFYAPQGVKYIKP